MSKSKAICSCITLVKYSETLVPNMTHSLGIFKYANSKIKKQVKIGKNGKNRRQDSQALEQN